MGPGVFLLQSALFVLALFYFKEVNIRQDTSYMDEIFHVPQAQKYCSGNFTEWDPMITTLPGLYLSSAAPLSLVSSLLNVPPLSLCTVHVLRAFNLLCVFTNVCIQYTLVCALHPGCKNSVAVMTSASLVHFPVLYLVSFLYYTDPGAVLCFLLMYTAGVKGRHWLAALSGLAAVLFRQTNIVWVVFTAGVSCERDLVAWIHRCPSVSQLGTGNASTVKQLARYITSKHSLSCISSVVLKCVPYAVLVCMFMLFVYVNDGIVVGDKSHHQACLNFPQLFYFLCTCAGFGFCHFLSIDKCLKCLRSIIDHPFAVTLFFISAFYAISNYTFVHEYLLADNRHYTFYIWSRIYRRYDSAKFVLIPVYLVALVLVLKSVEHKTLIWRLIFITCVSVSLIPQKLLEFRYFIIPFYIWRLNIQRPQNYILWLEILTFAAINGLTMYLFLLYPFKWENSDEVQRFMW